MSPDQSPHHECTAHSGMTAKLNANLIVNAVGVILIATLLTIAIDIRASTFANGANILHVEQELSELKGRVLELERKG